MWGFSELAKQAEAAAAAAAQTASTTSTSSWFNLDALQETDEQKQQKAAPVNQPPPVEKQVIPAMSMLGSIGSSQLAASSPSPMPAMAAPPRPKGKLQIPVKTVEQPRSVATKAAPTKSLSTESEAAPSPSPQPPKEPEMDDMGNKDGWDDEDDLGLEDDDESNVGEAATAPPEEEKGSVPATEATPAEERHGEESQTQPNEAEEPKIEGGSSQEDNPPPHTTPSTDAAMTDGQDEATELKERDTPPTATEEPTSADDVAPEAVKDNIAASDDSENPVDNVSSEPCPTPPARESTTADAQPDTNEKIVQPPPPQISTTASATSDDGSHAAPAVSMVEEDRNGKNGSFEKDELMTMFSEQIKRVEANHQAEVSEMEARQSQALQDAYDQLKKAENKQKETENRLNMEVQKKQDQLSEVLRTNEGYKLRMDKLQREVSDMQQLLEKGSTDLGKAAAVHKRDIKVLQEQLLEREEKASTAKMEAERAEAARKKMAEDLEAIQTEHTALKKHSSEIAVELEERRMECMSLRKTVDELSEKNESLDQTVERLSLQLSNHNISKSEKDGELGRLKTDLDKAVREISQLQSEAREKESAAEAALSEYKKKAQNSLAMANSRIASAVEAKEEAELEARAARSTADTAMERAVKAEIASKEAVAEAKAYVAEMETATADAKAERDAAIKRMEMIQAKSEAMQQDLDSLVGEKNKLVTDLAHTQGRLEDEQERSRNIKEESERFKNQAQASREEVGKLRQQIRRLEGLMNDVQESKEAAKLAQKQEALADRDDATIAMLQSQLRDANGVIEDLKNTLNNAAETHEAATSPDVHSAHGNGSHGSTPLFYAMEKQAELKAAQNEINRLANLLADIQSDKMEAVEAKEEMRQEMEEAKAKLERFQKLSSSAPTDSESGLEPMPENSAATNIEYLKNIMMRYLNAKTVAEKKGLIPVISAVLCLTHEEQQDAIRALDDSASIGAVGNSLFESISGRFM